MLRECEFELTYSTGLQHEPKEFFTEALIESKSFDLGLGFFSTSGIRCLAYGFALFIANGGKMRVVINHILSEQDKMAIVKGQTGVIDDFEDRILNDVTRLCNTLSRQDEQFFRCFSYLISIDRIEFVATVSTQGGLGHDKYGVFTDGGRFFPIRIGNDKGACSQRDGERPRKREADRPPANDRRRYSRRVSATLSRV